MNHGEFRQHVGRAIRVWLADSENDFDLDDADIFSLACAVTDELLQTKLVTQEVPYEEHGKLSEFGR